MFERILTRNHDPVWIFYFALTASVALVGALGLAASDWLPSLSGRNLPLLFILMAYIFGFAFAYGLLGFLASRPFRSPVHRQLAGWSAVFVVAIGYPMGINMLVSHEAAQLRATDRPLARPLPDFRSIGFKDQYLFRHVAPDSREFMATLQCNEPCIRLLYNGAVDKVVVEVTAYESPLKTFTRTISYSLERHSECPAPNIASSTDWRWDRGPEGDTASDRVVRRIAGGECLIGVPVEQIDADLLLDTRSPTATPFFPHGYQTESLLWRKPALGSMRIRLIDQRRGEEPLFQKTGTNFLPLFPLFYAQGDGKFFKMPVDWAFPKEEVLRAVFQERLRKPDDMWSREELRVMLDRLLNDNGASRNRVALAARAYFSSLLTGLPPAEQELATAIRLIADDRLTDTHALGRTIDRFTPTQSGRLARALVARLMATERGRPEFQLLSPLARLFTQVSAADFAEIGRDLMTMVATPRIAAAVPANIVARFAELGPDGVAHNMRLVRQGLSDPKLPMDHSSVDRPGILGALIGLCQQWVDSDEMIELILDLLRVDGPKDPNPAKVGISKNIQVASFHLARIQKVEHVLKQDISAASRAFLQDWQDAPKPDPRRCDAS
jgi:hypothetical protein